MNRYSTDKEIEKIKNWKASTPEEQMKLFKYVQNIWEGNQSYKEKDTGGGEVRYTFSIGGCSGNEELIDAMKKNNNLFWRSTFENSIDDNYVFYVKL